MTDFAARWLSAAAALGPLCAGIDPHRATLAEWGLPDTADGVRAFADAVLDAARGNVAIVKPQSAFFERFGSAGIAVLEHVLTRAAEEGMLAILDAKRGDIGTTMEAYAAAIFRAGGPSATAATFSPYLGVGALAPAFEAAASVDGAVIVVTQSSNPEGRTLQRAAAGGTTVQQHVVDETVALTARLGVPDGAAGFVVSPASTGGIEVALPAGRVVLCPGIGAQGLTPAAALEAFPPEIRPYVVLAASRGVSSAGPDPRALRDRVVALAEECRKAADA